MPTFDPATWRLTSAGSSSRSSRSSYQRAARAAACAPGVRLPLRHRLDGARTCTGQACASPTSSRRSKPPPEAHALQFVSAEQPYLDYLTMEQALLHDVMLAYEMDGKPLAREHGAPVRLVIPEMYGYKSVKWLEPDQSRAARRSPGTGSTSATTATRGSAARTATTRELGPPLLADRAHAALGERRRVLPAARDRADPLSAATVDPRRAAAAR